MVNDLISAKLFEKNRALKLRFLLLFIYSFIFPKGRGFTSPTVQTNGNDFKTHLLLSNKVWQGSSEAEEFPASGLVNLSLKQFQLGKKGWTHYRKSLNHRISLEVLFFNSPWWLVLHYTVQNKVNGPGFCITEEALKFWSLKGTIHHQLSGNWRGEFSYLFSQTRQLLLWSEGQLWPYGPGKSSATATGAPPAGGTAPLLAGEKWDTEYILILHQSWALQQIENFKVHFSLPQQWESTWTLSIRNWH